MRFLLSFVETVVTHRDFGRATFYSYVSSFFIVITIIFWHLSFHTNRIPKGIVHPLLLIYFFFFFFFLLLFFLLNLSKRRYSVFLYVCFFLLQLWCDFAIEILCKCCWLIISERFLKYVVRVNATFSILCVHSNRKTLFDKNNRIVIKLIVNP